MLRDAERRQGTDHSTDQGPSERRSAVQHSRDDDSFQSARWGAHSRAKLDVGAAFAGRLAGCWQSTELGCNTGLLAYQILKCCQCAAVGDVISLDPLLQQQDGVCRDRDAWAGGQ